MSNVAMQLAVERAGGSTELARRIGTSRQLVDYWASGAKYGAAAQFVLAIERETGVSRHDLRPDVYPRGVAA